MCSRICFSYGRIIALLFFLVVSAFARPAFALLPGDNYTEAEKAGFAFYHLSGKTPHFENWLPVPANADAIKRLRYGYNGYRPDEDLIHIETKAVLHMPVLPLSELAPGIMHSVRIDFVPDITTVLFPFAVGDQWVALVPDIGDHIKIVQFDGPTYKKISELLDMHNGQQPVSLSIVLRPHHADAKEPMAIYDKTVWLVMGSIADFEIWDAQHRVMAWSRNQPWYTTERTRQILNLYER